MRQRRLVLYAMAYIVRHCFNEILNRFAKEAPTKFESKIGKHNNGPSF